MHFQTILFALTVASVAVVSSAPMQNAPQSSEAQPTPEEPTPFYEVCQRVLKALVSQREHDELCRTFPTKMETFDKVAEVDSHLGGDWGSRLRQTSALLNFLRKQNVRTMPPSEISKHKERISTLEAEYQALVGKNDEVDTKRTAFHNTLVSECISKKFELEDAIEGVQEIKDQGGWRGSFCRVCCVSVRES
jgi:hypothetical protein